MSKLLILLVRGYQLLISPLFPPVCRFHPSCSAYAMGALRTHGTLYGVWLTTVRLLKCHPFHPGGLDPVPPKAGHNLKPNVYSKG